MRLESVKKSIQNSPFWKEITVEPTIFFYYTTYVMIDLVNVNLYLQKSCRFNATVEPNLNTPCDDEKRGVTFVAEVNSKYKFILYMTVTVVVALASSWSDEVGKKVKLLIIIPIIGQILQICSACLQTYFWYWPPILAVASDLFCSIVTGGHVLFLNAVLIYVCAISAIESRTMRTGVLTAFQLLCQPLGSGLSGFIIRRWGFLCAYVLGLISTIVSLVLALVFIKDVSEPVNKKITFLGFFNFFRIIRSFKILFKKDLGRKKIVVGLLLFVHLIVWFSADGEKTVVYLYFRYRFKWNEQTYGFYLVYKLFGVLIGTSFCSIVLSKHYKVHDGLIGAFAGFFDTVAILCYFFANQDWQLYLIAVLHIFHGAAIAVHYSFISKYFESHEFGRLTSVLNTMGLLTPLCHPLYNMVFQNTIDTMPSCFYLISVFINTLVSVSYAAAYYVSKKVER